MNATFVDLTRGRFMRLRHGRSVSTIAPLIPLSRDTICAFLHGEPVRATTVRKIAQWCEREEEATDATYPA